MKKNFLWVLKMATFYSFLGLLLQAILVNILFAASPSEGQNLRDIKVSVKAVDISLEQAFRLIEQRTSFKFNYIKEDIPLSKKVTMIVDDESLYQILEVFAKDYGLVFNRINNQIVVRKANDDETRIKESIGEYGSVKGKVTDSTTGDPLIGTTVYLVGTSLGDAVNIEGEYHITKIPIGKYVLRFSYIGYKSKEVSVNIPPNETVNIDVRLEPDYVEGKEIVVSSQAIGQAAAINQQISSNTIINVVSEQKIQELPDANAAEAIGRLPGVALQRSGGEANKIVLRGMSDQFTNITVDGVKIAPTDADSRGVDLSTISQGTLAGIELYKALTPDKDADAIAGSVNLVTKKAPSERVLWLDTKGSYNYLNKNAGQYDFSLRYGERFFDNLLGVQLTGNLEQRDRSKENYLLEYDQTLNNGTDYEISNFTLNYTNEVRKRNGFSVLLDLNTPDEGSIKFSNIFNKTSRDAMIYTRNYPTGTDDLNYSAENQKQDIITFNSSIRGENNLLGFTAVWNLSFAQSKAEYPYDYTLNFQEPSTTVSKMKNLPPDILKGPPELLIPYAWNNFQKSYLFSAIDRNENNLDKEKTAILDLSNKYTLGDNISWNVKFGGKYRYKNRFKDMNESLSPYFLGSLPQYVKLDNGTIVQKDFSGTRFSSLVLDAGKVLTTNFLDPIPQNRNLFNIYNLSPMINKDALSLWHDLNINGYNSTSGNDPEYNIDYEAQANFYDIIERVSAGYLMNTLNFGQDLTLIAGLRIENENNDYHSKFTPNSLGGFPTPTGVVRDTSVNYSETIVLPNIHVMFQPLDFLKIRLAAYKAIARPDFNQRLINFIARQSGGIFYQGNEFFVGNPNLKAAQAWNFEINTSVFNNTVGLISVSAFYKNIINMFHLMNGVPVMGQNVLDSLGIKWKDPFSNVAYALTYPYNSSKPTHVWGFEFEHQANLRFLPGLLKNIVLSYNFSFVRSETYVTISQIQYYTVGIHQKFRYVLTDTKQKLEGQPEFFGNLAIGYDIGGFSARLSVFYQSNYDQSYSGDQRSDIGVNRFTRWDLILKQEINNHISVMMNFNNLSDLSEGTSILNRINNWSLLQTNERYGVTADLGLRLTL